SISRPANLPEHLKSETLISKAADVQTAQMAAEAPKQKAAEESPLFVEKKEGDTAEVGFRKMMRRVRLEDLIQLECMNCKSTLLEIANDQLHGRIYIKRGEIVHAIADNVSSVAALQRLLALRGGEFSLKATEPAERRTIHGQWMQLLM